MKYISTRGQAPALNFEDVLLTGLAPESPFIDLGIGAESYLESMPSKKLRELRRRRRRLEEEGRVTIEVYDGAGNLDRLLTEGFAVEAASGDGGTFASAIGAVRAATGLPLVLVSGDPAVMEAGAGALRSSTRSTAISSTP